MSRRKSWLSCFCGAWAVASSNGAAKGGPASERHPGANVCLALTGVTDTISMVLRNIIHQLATSVSTGWALGYEDANDAAPHWDVLLRRQPGFSFAGSTPRPTRAR